MKKVLVRGPALSRSGYGEHTRFVLRALRDVEDEFDVYLINTPWGQTSWLYEDNDERKWIDSLLMKTIDAGQTLAVDLSVQVTVPNEWVRVAPKNIGVTAGIETDRISDSWIRGTNMVDKIIVPSTHSKLGFDNAYVVAKDPMGEEREIKVTTPIDVVSYPVRNISKEVVEFPFNTKFNFLTVAQLSPRKNIETSLVSFLEEFHNEPDVGMVLKVGIKNNSLSDREHTESAIGSLLENFPDRKCKVYLLHGNMSDSEIQSLYNDKTVSAYVSSSHGEGFGLPIFEAAYSALPVIAPAWSGHVDFLYAPVTNVKSKKTTVKPLFEKVAFDIKPVTSDAHWDGVVTADSKDYEIYVAQINEFVVGSTEKRVNKQPTLGSLFYSQNGVTFTPAQNQDLTFRMHRAKFTNATATAKFTNAPIPLQLLENNPITTDSGSNVVTVFHPHHGMQVGQGVTLSGVDSLGVGGISAATLNKKYNIDDMIKGDVIFCATGVTDGDLTKGVKDLGNEFEVTTFVLHKSKKVNKIIRNIYNK